MLKVELIEVSGIITYELAIGVELERAQIQDNIKMDRMAITTCRSWG